MVLENTRPYSICINGNELAPHSITIDADKFYFDPDLFIPVPKDPIGVIGPNGYIDFKNGYVYKIGCDSTRNLKVIYGGNVVAELELADTGEYRKQTSLLSDLQEVL